MFQNLHLIVASVLFLGKKGFLNKKTSEEESEKRLQTCVMYVNKWPVGLVVEL